MARCDETEHSWAWISPSGEFIEVRNHTAWATEHGPHKEECILNIIEDINLEALTHGGWTVPYGSSEVYKTTESYYRLIVQSLLEQEAEAPEDPEYKPSRVVKHTILPEYWHTLWMQKYIKGMPNLSTRDENKLILTLTDKLGDWFQDTEVILPDKKREKQKEKQKEIYEGAMKAIGMASHVVTNTMLSHGWMKVTNAFAVSVSPKGVWNTKLWDALFTESMRCLTDFNVMDKTFYLSLDDSREDSKSTFGEVLVKYTSRKVSEAIFEILMSKVRMARQIRYRYASGLYL
jgi:hypothetical protein